MAENNSAKIEPEQKSSDTTSPSIIVNSGQLMKDHALDVDGESSDDTVDMKPLAQHEMRIEPISSSEELKAESKPEQAKSETESTGNDPNKNSVIKTQVEDQKEVSQPNNGNVVKKPSVNSEVSDTQDQKQTEMETLERLDKVVGMVNSKMYFLPINLEQKRRNAKLIIIGFVFILVLIVVWVDFTLDAGLIHTGFHIPHTHFFELNQ